MHITRFIVEARLEGNEWHAEFIKPKVEPDTIVTIKIVIKEYLF